MSDLGSFAKPASYFLLAALSAASVWFYFDRILVRYQVEDAALHARPRGNLSDLYPRWLGARELLLHHRNPYSDEITLEIQKGYYGRVLDPARPDDPKDQQGFAYPAYVVFLLAPFIGLPFDVVQVFFHWLLIALTVTSVWLWLRALRWRISPLATVTAVTLTLGSVSAVQGIKLQQLSLLMAALLAASAACIVEGLLFCGGILLALATIKPQLTIFIVAWLLLWALSDWRVRRRFIYGFGLTMAVLLVGAEMVLPHWWTMFAHAIGKYHQYTQNRSVMAVLFSSLLVGNLLASVAGLGCIWLAWRLCRRGSDEKEFGSTTALVMALTVLVVPMSAPYNQVLLVPAILALVRDRLFFKDQTSSVRFACAAGAVVLAWQWFAGFALASCYILASPSAALKGWKWPFFTTLVTPVIVFGLIWWDVKWAVSERPDHFRSSRKVV